MHIFSVFTDFCNSTPEFFHIKFLNVQLELEMYKTNKKLYEIFLGINFAFFNRIAFYPAASEKPLEDPQDYPQSTSLTNLKCLILSQGSKCLKIRFEQILSLNLFPQIFEEILEILF